MNQKCQDPCPGSCVVITECHVINYTPICYCSLGYTGNPVVLCNKKACSRTHNHSCTPSEANAICREQNGAGSCSCCQSISEIRMKTAELLSMRNVKNLVQFLVCAAFSLSVPYFNIDPCITVWMDVLEILKTIPTCTNPNIKSIATVCTVKNVSIVIASVHALAHQSRVPASPARKSTIVLRICWMHACNNKDYRKCRPVCERDTWR